MRYKTKKPVLTSYPSSAITDPLASSTSFTSYQGRGLSVYLLCHQHCPDGGQPPSPGLHTHPFNLASSFQPSLQAPQALLTGDGSALQLGTAVVQQATVGGTLQGYPLLTCRQRMSPRLILLQFFCFCQGVSLFLVVF